MSFDPTEHWATCRRCSDDFAVGEVFRAPSRTMTKGVFAAVHAASGDNHPIHHDRASLARRGHRDLTAHGDQTYLVAFDPPEA